VRPYLEAFGGGADGGYGALGLAAEVRGGAAILVVGHGEET